MNKRQSFEKTQLIDEWEKEERNLQPTEKALQYNASSNPGGLQTVIDGFCIMDMKGNILDISDRAARICGHSLRELHDGSLYDIDTRTPLEIVKHLKNVVKNRPDRFVMKLPHKDGRITEIEVITNFIEIGDGLFFCLFREITEKRHADQVHQKKEKELDTKTRALKEINMILNDLLEKRQSYKAGLENMEILLSNLKELAMPYLEIFNRILSDETQKAYLNILESKLNEIISPSSLKHSYEHLRLTPAQIQIATLVRGGKTTREIANLLNLSEKTIQDHRKNIRKKLGIINKKVNLKSYLTTFA
jgi:PAS domain S-box-containing protein